MIDGRCGRAVKAVALQKGLEEASDGRASSPYCGHNGMRW